MNTTWSIWLGGKLPPSENLRLIGPRRFLSSDARAFYAHVADTCERFKAPRFNCWVIVECRYVLPDRLRRDVANTLKCLLDGLEKAGVLVDDKFAIPRILSVHRIHNGPAPDPQIPTEPGEGGATMEEEGVLVQIREAQHWECPAGEQPKPGDVVESAGGGPGPATPRETPRKGQRVDTPAQRPLPRGRALPSRVNLPGRPRRRPSPYHPVDKA